MPAMPSPTSWSLDEDIRRASTLPAAEGSGVIGTLRYHHNVTSKHLKFPRHVAVWLPPGYDNVAARRDLSF